MWMLHESGIGYSEEEEREMIDKLIPLSDLNGLEKIVDQAKQKTPDIVDGSGHDEKFDRERTYEYNKEHHMWRALERQAWRVLIRRDETIPERLLWKATKRGLEIGGVDDVVNKALSLLVKLTGKDNLEKLHELRRFAFLNIHQFRLDTRTHLQAELEDGYYGFIVAGNKKQVRSIYEWTKDYRDGWIHKLMLAAVRRFYELSPSK